MPESRDLGIDLPKWHPAEGMFGSARQCAKCGGIWFPGPADCPYCDEDAERSDAS